MKNWMELLLQNQEEKDQKDLEVVHGALAEMVGQESTLVNRMEQFNLCLYAQGIRERQEKRRLNKQMAAEYEQFRKTIWLPPQELALEHDEDAQVYLDKAFASLKALEEQPFYPSASDREDLQRFISNMQLWQKVCREVVMV